MVYEHWKQYSSQICERIKHPWHVGSISEKEANARKMFLAKGKEGIIEERHAVLFSLLVDPEDGIIADCRFEAYGESLLIAIADVTCELCMRKNYQQVLRLSTHLIEKHLVGDHTFPQEGDCYLNLVLSALDTACHLCQHIPIANEEIQSPVEVHQTAQILDGGEWDFLSQEEKIKKIETVIQREIQPYIALDAGGITIQSLKGYELTIAYEGACTSCPASTGSTLDAIQEILRSQVHPNLSVVPDLSFLQI